MKQYSFLCLILLKVHAEYVVPKWVTNFTITNVSDADAITVRVDYTFIRTILDDSFAEVPEAQFLHINYNELLSEVDDFAFRGLNNVTELYMTNNSLSAVPNLTFICKNLQIIDLQKNEIETVPSEVFQPCTEITLMNLAKNRLIDPPDFSAGSLNLSLLTLHLDENRIQTIPENSLSGVESLQVLTITRNNLTTIESSSMPNMRMLALTENNLESLPVDLFLGSKITNLNIEMNRFSSLPNLTPIGKTLKELKAGSNKLSEILLAHFTNMTALSSVSLAANMLMNTSYLRVLSTAPNLISLDLGNNKLANIATENLIGFLKLKHLILKRNGVKDIPNFPNMPELINLDLSENDIVWFTPESLKNATKLYSLQLTYNKLAKMPDVSAIPSLKFAYFSNNLLSQLNASLIAKLPHLTQLQLENNSFTSLPDLVPVQSQIKTILISRNPLSTLDPEKFVGPGFNFDALRNGSIKSNVALYALDANLTFLTKISDEFLLIANNLTTLYLHSSNITVFPNVSIVQKKLKTLVMANNSLLKIPHDYLRKMMNLETLDIAQNNLTSFPFEILTESPALKSLKLAQNHFKIIPDLRQFTNRTTELKIDLTGNPLKCNISLCWLRELNVNSKLKVALSTSPCKEPPELVNKQWTSISWNTLLCHTAPPYADKTYQGTFLTGGETSYDDQKSSKQTSAYKLTTARGRLHCAAVCSGLLKYWDLRGCAGFKYDSKKAEMNCQLFIANK